jgi:hypothetical protein
MLAISEDISALRCAMNSSSEGFVEGVAFCSAVEEGMGALGECEVSVSGLPGPEAEGVGCEGAFASALADVGGAAELAKN